MLEYSIFKIDVYEISYLKGTDGVEQLQLDYKRDIKREYSIEGWKVGLEHLLKSDPSLEKKMDWIISKTVDLKEGDKFTIKRRGEHVQLFKNNEMVGEIKDQVIAKLVFEPWLGKVPVDESLKAKLLGEKES